VCTDRFAEGQSRVEDGEVHDGMTVSTWLLAVLRPMLFRVDVVP
jgi:hypothetical protein